MSFLNNEGFQERSDLAEQLQSCFYAITLFFANSLDILEVHFKLFVSFSKDVNFFNIIAVILYFFIDVLVLGEVNFFFLELMHYLGHLIQLFVNLFFFFLKSLLNDRTSLQ